MCFLYWWKIIVGLIRVNYLGNLDIIIEILCKNIKNVFLSFKNSFSFSSQQNGKRMKYETVFKSSTQVCSFILFFKIFRTEEDFSEKQKHSKHPTAEPWPAIFPNLIPCSSAMRMWTDLVLNLPTHLHLGWFCTQCLALGLYWLSLETSWWWLQFFTSSSCIHQPIYWSPLWPARTF